VLVALRDKEELLLYISATPQVISAVLVVEREGGRQRRWKPGPREGGATKGCGKVANPGPWDHSGQAFKATSTRAAPGVLCERGTPRRKGALPAGTEDVVRHPHGVPKAVALFPSASGHYGYLIPPWPHPLELEGTGHTVSGQSNWSSLVCSSCPGMQSRVMPSPTLLACHNVGVSSDSSLTPAGHPSKAT
jgi:hypothetical protein